MRWTAPSERTQLIIMSPLWVPLVAAATPILLFAVSFHWCLAKLFPRPNKEWHQWFAWRPVRFSTWSEQNGRWTWLETVQRRAGDYNWPTEYWPIEEEPFA